MPQHIISSLPPDIRSYHALSGTEFSVEEKHYLKLIANIKREQKQFFTYLGRHYIKVEKIMII